MACRVVLQFVAVLRGAAAPRCIAESHSSSACAAVLVQVCWLVERRVGVSLVGCGVLAWRWQAAGWLFGDAFTS